MSAVLLPLWLVLLASAGALTVRAVRAGRRDPHQHAPRWHVVTVALLAATVAGTAASIFGLGPAAGGAAAIRHESASLGDEPGAPARARLFLRQVRIDRSVRRVGYSPDADVVLPGLYRLAEAERGWDLLNVKRVDGAERISIGERGRPEPTGTRMSLRGSASPLPRGDRRALAAACKEPTRRDNRAEARTVTVALCTGRLPRAVLTFETVGNAILLTAEVWRRGRLEPHHIEIDPSALIQIGAASAAVPGVTLWEVPAPRDRSELFSAPPDLLGSCDTFASSVYTGTENPVAPFASDRRAVCAIPFAPPFALEVRRLVPDVGGVTARGAWSASLLLAPLFGWALMLLLRRRTRVTRGDVADLSRFAVLTVSITAVIAARLLWAHRIDMLRDWQVAGERVHDNLVSTAAVAAALALAATLGALRENPRRVHWGVVAFLGALVVGSLGIPGELDVATGRVAGQLALAAILGTASLWSRSLPEALERRPHAALLLVAGAALATHWIAPRAVAIKLLLATASIVLCYRSLRFGLLHDSSSPRPSSSPIELGKGVLASLAVIGSMALLDTGLTAVFCLPGLFVAASIAGHDALFGDRSVSEVKSYRLRQVPLLWLQGGLLGSLVVAVALWAIVGLITSASGTPNPNLAAELTGAAPHLLWVVAALFAAPAMVARARGDRTTAILFGSATAVVIIAWLFRDHLAELVLSSSAPAALRYAVIADPGYALLADPGAFLSGITGWAETILAGSSSTWTGDGYFGAQLLDPGVLLSVENDYLPILILREQGVLGIAMWTLTSLGALAIAWLAGRECFGLATAAARGRLALVIVMALVVVYQPLAALGAVPLTGVSWSGLGIDSPADLWMLIGVLVYLAAIGASARSSDEGRHERALRRSRRFLRKERWVAAATAIATVAGTLLVVRGAVFATGRPRPVADSGLASEPFAGLEAALDYARSLTCSLAPDDSLSVEGQATADGTKRYHRRLLRSLRERDKAKSSLRVGFVTLVLTRDEDAEPGCAVKLDRRALAALRIKPPEPYRSTRVRLVSAPMGRAAGDHGELVSGGIVIRLRATQGEIDAPRAAGLYATRRVALAPDIAIATDAGGGVILQRAAPAAGEERSENWLFVSKTSRAPVGLRSTETVARWTPVDESAASVDLDKDALIVVGRGSSRNVWLYRAATPPPPRTVADTRRPVVPALLADDARSVTGARRRLYLYGNELPELGWVNPYRPRHSVGLDGWVAAAVAEFNPDLEPTAPSCGSLAPPSTSLARVCTAKPSEDVIECQVSLQPELSLDLRHLTEMIAVAPADFAGAGEWVRPLRSSFVVLRGDTGEIAAQGSFVPGRSSSAYAPTTSALEAHLVRLREDRDPATGVKLPVELRGEASAEKVEHNRPIAVGSVIKPMMGRAFEQTAPTFARRLTLVGAPTAGGACRRGRAHAILGHCPPTDSLWNQRRALGTRGFIAHSANWYLAAIGLLGTALPDGSAGLGAATTPIALEELVMRNVGDVPGDSPLWTRYGGTSVIGSDRRVDVEALRATAMWQRFEALVGRPLCTSGNKAGCAAAAVRRDVCAARAMPVARPTADLRQLVSLGPDRFDFYPRLRRPERTMTRVPTREYLQFLRGSGLHPIGTLAQMSDAFNRVVYEADRDPLIDGGYELAASWFPVPATGVIPRNSCRSVGSGNTVADGLCEVVRRGTGARALRQLLDDPRIEVYGAKTGTIDSLGDIGSSKRACERFRQAHTLSDRRRTAESQPYWLECDRRGEHDDSLLLVSFAVVTSAGGRVPLTIGIGFQRSGSGFAAHVAAHYIDVVASYFGAGEEGLP